MKVTASGLQTKHRRYHHSWQLLTWEDEDEGCRQATNGVDDIGYLRDKDGKSKGDEQPCCTQYSPPGKWVGLHRVCNLA